MRFIAACTALAIAVVVLVDVFEAMVLPRRATRKYRPARLYYRSLWLAWRRLSLLWRPGPARQLCFSVFGPLSLLALFAAWATGLIIAFGVLHWSLGAPLANQDRPPSLATCLYLSGETFFTLGYGDLTPTSVIGRALSVIESGIGFGFMAIVIGYLPVLYQAFSRRELMIALLDARAGSPPTAGELLMRLARHGDLTSLPPLLEEWERWSAELLEAQLSFPVLAYYRSQHDNQSWLACLATILDTCSLLMTQVPQVSRYQVEVTFAMARHTAVDLALIFKTPPSSVMPSRLSQARAERLTASLDSIRAKTIDSDSTSTRLEELRAMYEPFLDTLANHFRFELPPIVSDDVVADNWQRSAWTKRTPGIGDLPSTEQHFS